MKLDPPTPKRLQNFCRHHIGYALISMAKAKERGDLLFAEKKASDIRRYEQLIELLQVVIDQDWIATEDLEGCVVTPDDYLEATA